MILTALLTVAELGETVTPAAGTFLGERGGITAATAPAGTPSSRSATFRRAAPGAAHLFGYAAEWRALAGRLRHRVVIITKKQQ